MSTQRAQATRSMTMATRLPIGSPQRRAAIAKHFSTYVGPRPAATRPRRP